MLKNISFDHCIKCTVCTIYCPVARVSLFPGPKQSGPDAERLRIKSPGLVDESLKYCSNCKRCEISCPSDVKIADIIQEAKWKYVRKGRFRPRDFLLSRTDYIGKIAILVNSVVNYFLRRNIIKFLLYIFFKIPFQKAFPAYEKCTFEKYYKTIISKNSQSQYKEDILYFHGCFVNYNDHRLGADLIKVLNAMNIGVTLAKEKCCGVPLIANGYIAKAKKNAEFNIQSLSESKTRFNSKIITSSPSCTYALKNEYSNLLGLDNSLIKDDIEYITKFLSDQFTKGNFPAMKPVSVRAAYHSPCHLERTGGVIYTIDILKQIPGLELIILYSECCGIAGTYGFKKEYYKISQDIGKELFKSIDAVNPEIVITDCETCALQIAMNTTYKVLHPVNILAMAIE